jgi:hypothetical protein
VSAVTSPYGPKIARLAADVAQLRLLPSDIAELRYFFNELAADIGVRSLRSREGCGMLLVVREHSA